MINQGWVVTIPFARNVLPPNALISTNARNVAIPLAQTAAKIDSTFILAQTVSEFSNVSRLPLMAIKTLKGLSLLLPPWLLIVSV